MQILPLSDFQYSVWKGQKMFPDSPLYNMVFTFDIFGSINEDIFFEAFALLVQNTSSFNLILEESDRHNPKQQIAELAPQMDFIDAASDGQFDLNTWMEVKNQMNFDLSERSYYSALIKKSDTHYVWYFNQHHIFTDAYCFQLSYNKMSEIYAELAEGKEIEIESDKQEYITSCLRQTPNQIGSKKRSIARDSLMLYGRSLMNHGSTASNRFQFTLEQDLLSEIKEFLSSQGVRTLAANLDFLTFLISSLVITLSKVGDNDNEHLLSNIFSQRFTKKNKALVKPLLDVLNTKLSWSADEGYQELHKRVYAFLIMRESEIEDSNTLLPSTIINFFDLRFEEFAGFNSTYIWHHCGHMDSHHCLRFHIFKYSSTDQFTLALDIKGEEDDTLIGKRLSQDLEAVIRQLVKGECSIDKMSILSKSAITLLNNEAKSIYSKHITKEQYFINVLQSKATLTPDATAIHDNNQVITYQQLLSQSHVLAQRISSICDGSNKKVAIYLPRSQAFIYSIIGSLLQGGSFVPIPYDFPVARAQYIVNDVAADLIILSDKEVEVDIPKLNFDSIHNELPIEENINGQVGEDFYTLFTSGSSGRPKGVPISHAALSSYLASASSLYLEESKAYHMPLFTSVGFDLTMTSIFLPLYTGGSISIFPEVSGIDLSIRDVIGNDIVNTIKCTPSHLKLIKGLNISNQIDSFILGGENFSRVSADALYKQSNMQVSIFNEYGPTECTIGCIVHKYNPETYHDLVDVPIGRPMQDCTAFIADEYGVPVPDGVIGELCLISHGLSSGYLNDEALTQEKYIVENKIYPHRYYRSGDFARLNTEGIFEYLGRKDAQIKMQGIRIEKGEIENLVETHSDITACVVLKSNQVEDKPADYIHCAKCGLPSNYPTADFDEDNVCGFCRNYTSYEKKVEKYFETEQRFAEIFNQTKPHDGEYDCIMLYSGGKDSTYALGKLVAMGLKVLTFTLDNGYISDNAKENISRIVKVLNVDHVFGSTPYMNEIFVDSLKTHCNVCNGCFKTIYNLSLKIAYDKKIPIIVTGLSRGQFFETKLSEEIFWKPMDDVKEIDRTLYAAREAYHGVRDVAYQKTDGAFIEEKAVLKSVKIVDFYRYHDVTLEQLYTYINTDLPWIRPEDTGRSTNCLINKVGIYIHRQEKGYSNYAFPYSWDVRTGHKTKEETIDEIEEVITEDDVLQIIREIGYESEASESKLVAYYTGQVQPSSELRQYVSSQLPDYMVPSQFIHVEHIPMTLNGKVDYAELEQIEYKRSEPIRQPENELEELLLTIWKEVMLLDVISIDDNFFEIGGTSLHAIRIVARLEKAIEYSLGVQIIFQKPTIEMLSQYILEDMQSILDNESN